jgi:hypothetical protein
MATKGSSEKIKSPEEQDAIRKASRERRTHRRPQASDGSHTPGVAEELSVFAAGRERQVIAIKSELDKMEISQRRQEFLVAMLSVYAQLQKSDRRILVDGKSKEITSVAATVRKIEEALGDEILDQFQKDWSHAKTDFYQLVNVTCPLNKYCSAVQEERDQRQRATEERLSQSLGSLINMEMFQPV